MKSQSQKHLFMNRVRSCVGELLGGDGSDLIGLNAHEFSSHFEWTIEINSGFLDKIDKETVDCALRTSDDEFRQIVCEQIILGLAKIADRCDKMIEAAEKVMEDRLCQ